MGTAWELSSVHEGPHWSNESQTTTNSLAPGIKGSASPSRGERAASCCQAPPPAELGQESGSLHLSGPQFLVSLFVKCVSCGEGTT